MKEYSIAFLKYFGFALLTAMLVVVIQRGVTQQVAKIFFERGVHIGQATCKKPTGLEPQQDDDSWEVINAFSSYQTPTLPSSTPTP